MTTQIALLVVDATMVTYTVISQIKLTRQNIFIESSVKRLSEIEKIMEKMAAFLS